MLKTLGIVFTAFGLSWGAAYAQTNPAHVVIIGTVNDVRINEVTMKNTGLTLMIQNRMGSVTVSGSGYKARLLSTGTWVDAEASPPTSGSIQFPLGFVVAAGSDAPQRSGYAFACLQLALVAKAQSKRFMYGARARCRSVNNGPPMSWQWQWNTFDAAAANNGNFTQTQDHQVIGAEHFVYPGGGSRTSYSNDGDFCAYEFNSSTYHWVSVSSSGISLFMTNPAGDYTPASANCGSGPGMDTKSIASIFPGNLGPIFTETNVSLPLSGGGPWDYYYNNASTYITSGRMSPAMWGCFSLIHERLKTGAAFTGGSAPCVLLPP